MVDLPQLRNQPVAESGQIAPISPSAPSPAACSSTLCGWPGMASVPGECMVGAAQYTFFSLRGLTCRQSYSSSLHSPETLRATLDHQKFTHVPSAPNVLPTSKNTRALSYASLAKTGSTLPVQHLLTPNNTLTPGPAPNVMLRQHLQLLNLWL